MRKSSLYYANATDKALAGEVAGVWVNSQTSSNQQTGGTRVVANCRRNAACPRKLGIPVIVSLAIYWKLTLKRYKN